MWLRISTDFFFSEDAEFRHEFNELYASLFNKPEGYIKIVDCLGRRKAGMTRSEILSATGMEDNGELSKMLENLSWCGFIRKYCHIGKKSKDSLYQLIDNYTIFYYQFINGKHGTDESYWSKVTGRPEYNSWCGLAFERLCFRHIRQIKNALGIAGVLTSVHSWSAPSSQDSPGAQIDLLIDRADNIIDVCEVKYTKGQFSISNSYRMNLLNKMQRLSESLPNSRKAIQLVLITNNGVSHNQNSDIVINELTLDDLYKI